MNIVPVHRLVVLAVFTALYGCSSDATPSSPQLSRITLKSAVHDAPNLVVAAKAGRLGRGEQDLLVALEAQLPGFGGFYIANGAVRVHMKGSARSTAQVRSTLHPIFAAHKNHRVREVLANMKSATVLPAAYTLSELIAIENRIAGSPVRLPGWTGVGTSIMLNRVVVMFNDEAALRHGLSIMEAIGVPATSLHPIVVPPITVRGTWSDAYRPTRAGIAILIGNNGRWPGFWGWTPKGDYVYFTHGYECSLGFNVRNSAGVTHFLTAAHCATDFAGVNGAVGDTVFQARRLISTYPPSHGPIGTFTVNPAFSEGQACPINPATQTNYDFCTTADVALGQYLPGITGERKVGTLRPAA